MTTAGQAIEQLEASMGSLRRVGMRVECDPGSLAARAGLVAGRTLNVDARQLAAAAAAFGATIRAR